jgi:hypothetical protein
MLLKTVVKSLDDIDEKYRDLYTERNGQYELTEIEGVKTQSDIDRLQNALARERSEHKATKSALSAFGDLKPDEVFTQLDKLKEHETLSENAEIAPPSDKVQKLVESRLQAKIAPIEREREQLRARIAEQEKLIAEFRQKDIQRQINESVRSAANTAKLLPAAIDDALLLAERVFEVDDSGKVITKENCGFMPGIDAQTWLSDIQSKRPHWWAPSVGGGAVGHNGGGAYSSNNPWSAENWNLTKQAEILMKDRARANNLASVAGTTIGGPKPTRK